MPGGAKSYINACTSVPQIAESLILTNTWSGPGSGMGIFSTEKVWLPLYIAAFKYKSYVNC